MTDFALVACQSSLVAAKILDHENLHVINHNSIRGTDCDSFVGAKSRHITGDCHKFNCGPTSNGDRPA